MNDRARNGGRIVQLARTESGSLVVWAHMRDILYYTILYYTILYYTILYYTILYYTILYYTILYYTILYYTILYYTILYYTILYYNLPSGELQGFGLYLHCRHGSGC